MNNKSVCQVSARQDVCFLSWTFADIPEMRQSHVYWRARFVAEDPENLQGSAFSAHT